jgi:DNA-binding protein Fis
MVKNKIALSFATVALLMFTGCGSSSSDNDENPSSSSVSGQAIDGYLESALVCLDKNANNNCDAGEPMSITDIEGNYNLDGITASDKEKYAILVKAILGQTKDSDDNGTTIKNAFFLKAPASDASVVSPLTTMVQNKLENDPTLTVDTAIQDLKKTLNVSDDIDIMGDYVSKESNNTDSDTYKQLHKVAEVIADSIGQSLKENNIDADGTDVSDAGMIILDDLDTKLSDVMVKASDENFSVDNYVSDVNISIDSDTLSSIKDKKEKIALVAESTVKVSDSKIFENAVKDDGLYEYDFYAYNTSKNFYKTKVKVTNDKMSWTWEQYDYNTTSNSFEEYSTTYETSYYKSIDTIYVISDNGWTTKEISYDSKASGGFDDDVVFNSDGSMVSSNAWGSYKTTVLSVINLAGLPIKDFASSNYWDDEDSNSSAKYYIGEDILFSGNSEVIKTKTEMTNTNSITIYAQSCYSDDASKVDKEDMTCNDYGTEFYDAGGSGSQTFSDIIGFINYFAKDSGHYYWTDKYKAQFDTNNTIYYYDDSSELLPLTGKLALTTITGATFYEIQTPKEYTYQYEEETNTDNDDENSTDNGYSGSWDYSIILAAINGNLQTGYWDKSTGYWTDNFYNKQAIDELQSALEDGLK